MKIKYLASIIQWTNHYISCYEYLNFVKSSLGNLGLTGIYKYIDIELGPITRYNRFAQAPFLRKAVSLSLYITARECLSLSPCTRTYTRTYACTCSSFLSFSSSVAPFDFPSFKFRRANDQDRARPPTHRDLIRVLREFQPRRSREQTGFLAGTRNTGSLLSNQVDFLLSVRIPCQLRRSLSGPRDYLSSTWKLCRFSLIEASI